MLTVSVMADSEEAVRGIRLNVDTNKIAQVIRNLVSNGLKFTPSGGTVEVTLSVMDEGKGAKDAPCSLLVLNVKDSGAGISEVCGAYHYIQHVFDLCILLCAIRITRNGYSRRSCSSTQASCRKEGGQDWACTVSEIFDCV